MEISLKDLADILGIDKTSKNPFKDMVGKNFFIRTVTYHYTGKVDSIIGDFIKLTSAAWIAESGRFNDALKKEDFSEIEPYENPVYLNTGSIVDFTEISILRTSQK